MARVRERASFGAALNTSEKRTERMIWQKVLLIALAGAMGTLARYGLAGAVQRVIPPGFPGGTFAVNVLGSFLFGMVWVIGEERILISPEMRTVILTGFMGAFTTFSTFVFESEALLRNAEWLYFAANLGGQVVLGLVALMVGMAAGKLF